MKPAVRRRLWLFAGILAVLILLITVALIGVIAFLVAPAVGQEMVNRGILARADLAVGVLVVEGRPVVVSHEEHDGIRLPPGNYLIGRQVESVGGRDLRRQPMPDRGRQHRLLPSRAAADPPTGSPAACYLVAMLVAALELLRRGYKLRT